MPPEIESYTPDELKRKLAEREIGVRALNVLKKAFPGHYWVDEVTGGVLVIKNLALSGNWGFVVHLHKITDFDKQIARAGAELLERFRISRGRAGVTEAKDFLVTRMENVKQTLPSYTR